MTFVGLFALAPLVAFMLILLAPQSQARLAALVELDRWAQSWRSTPEESALILKLLGSGRATTVGAVLAAFAPVRRPYVSYGIVWLAMLPDDGPTGGFFHDRKQIAW